MSRPEEREEEQPVVESPPNGETTKTGSGDRVRQQELLAELGVTALRGARFDELLHQAVQATAEGLRTQFCKVLEHHPSEHCFLVKAGVGWGDGVVGVTTIGDDLESPAGYALRTKTPVISNHLELEKRFRTPAILQRYGIRRAMNVILQGDRRPYGVLEVDSRSDDKFEEPDLAFLQGTANLLGMALERQQRDADLRAALEHNRVLLKEMNHRVKNSLAIVSSMLNLQAARFKESTFAGELREAVLRIATIGKAHELLYGGVDAEWLDLGKYLEATCRDLSESLPGLTINVDAEHGIETAADHSIAAALIVNELVTNVFKYAYPKPLQQGDVWIKLTRHGTGFRVSVRDGGIGMAPGASSSAKGLGMRMVRALSQQMAGTIEIVSAERGTEIVLDVPSMRQRSSA